MSRKTTKRSTSIKRTAAKKTNTPKPATSKVRTSSEPTSHLSKGASVWKTDAPHARSAGSHALELAADGASAAGPTGLGGALLELVGMERLALAHALSAWQREQDRQANRAWRRPGGMVRPAGL